jgi:hypothetical protein
MNKMDLNVENYTLENLNDFFGLTNGPITEDIIISAKKKYNNIILDSTDTTEYQKRQLMSFIAQGIDKLLYSIRRTTNVGEPNSVNILKRNTPRYNPTQQTNNMGDLITEDILYSQNGSHSVVVPQPVPFINTSPGDFFGGVINPLEKRIITKQMCFDTILRENYSNTNSSEFVFILKEPLKNVVSMQLASIELPRMWYTYSKEQENVNMIINMYDQVSLPFVSIPIELPEGNYNTNDFTSTMNNIFKDNEYLKILLFYIDMVNGRSVIALDPTVDNPSNPSSPSYSPVFRYEVIFVSDCQDLRSTLGWSMGFRKDKYIVYANEAVVSYTYNQNSAVYFNGFLQSESTFGVNLENYVYFDVDDFNNSRVTGSITSQSFSTFIGQNILARISLSTVPFTIVENNKSDLINRTREYFGPVSINRLKVSLLNKFGFPIDLLKNDYSFVLEFKQLYTK